MGDSVTGQRGNLAPGRLGNAVAICLAAGVAAADPSADYRNLASWFGSRPETLDVQSLAELSTCVTGEIQVRAASPGPVPPGRPSDRRLVLGWAFLAAK
jgi:hypothetical protein